MSPDERDIDPDQESDFYQTYSTNNYVQYQQPAADGFGADLDISYAHPQRPQAAMIVFTGNFSFEFFGAMAAVHPLARVNFMIIDSGNVPHTYDGDRCTPYILP